MDKTRELGGFAEGSLARSAALGPWKTFEEGAGPKVPGTWRGVAPGSSACIGVRRVKYRVRPQTTSFSWRADPLSAPLASSPGRGPPVCRLWPGCGLAPPPYFPIPRRRPQLPKAAWLLLDLHRCILQLPLLFLGARRGSLLLRRIGESVELSAARLKGPHLLHFLITSRGPSGSSPEACNTQQTPTPPPTGLAGAHTTQPHQSRCQSRCQSHPPPQSHALSPC